MAVHERTTMLAHCNLKQKYMVVIKTMQLFSFYALPSGGKLKDAVVHYTKSYSIQQTSFSFYLNEVVSLVNTFSTFGQHNFCKQTFTIEQVCSPFKLMPAKNVLQYQFKCRQEGSFDLPDPARSSALWRSPST